MNSEDVFGKPIFVYTRRQAIEDGVLIDLNHIEVIRQQWKCPMACTTAVWDIIQQALQVEGQDVNGICHDISTMARLAVGKDRGFDRVYFSVLIAGTKRSLKLHVGPGDQGEPVLTLMFPNED